MEKFYKIYGYIFVRPRRIFFWKMIAKGSFGLRLIPKRDEFWGWRFPNLHWWILYHTVFKFFKWLYWDAWGKLCTYSKGGLSHKPLIARIIHRIGQTTAGMAISGGECFHCAFSGGDPVDLSEEDFEDGKYFELTDSGTSYTQDGTDYWFKGITTCPRCGFKQEYNDGT